MKVMLCSRLVSVIIVRIGHPKHAQFDRKVKGLDSRKEEMEGG